MSTKNQRLQRIFHHYESQQKHRPCRMRDAVQWAISKGWLQKKRVDEIGLMADEMVAAVRLETKTDSKGRKYRVNHAVRVSEGGVQQTFWGRMGYQAHDFMQRTFQQRREQIVGDCFHLKTDVDVYNDMTKEKNTPIDLVLDFGDDVTERQKLEEIQWGEGKTKIEAA